jgi:hypothetical protein
MANIINRQQTFSTNGTVTAAGLHNLIDTALVNSAIIKNQQEITTIGTADLLLIAPDSVDSSLAPRKVTVQNLLDDGLTSGTFTTLNLTGALTYGTATGNRTVSTSATITTGTIPNLTAGTTTSTVATITTGTIPTLTAGTTTGTAGIFTSGTVATLNSTTGTITNLSTTLAGDFTISQGTGTLGTSGATLGTYGGSTSIPSIVVDAKGRVTSASTSAISSSGLVAQRVYTTTSTWTKPSSLTRIKVTVVGGGASAGPSVATGASQQSGGGGGGSGGASIKLIEAADLGATITATIGTGGVGQSAGIGIAGATSSFGTHCSATGGSPGAGSAAASAWNADGGAGGAGSDGNINFDGGSGNCAAGGTFGAEGAGGGGGSTIFGGGGKASPIGAAGGAGRGYGAGGGGGANNQNTGSVDGGSGKAGIIIVEEYA